MKNKFSFKKSVKKDGKNEEETKPVEENKIDDENKS